MAPNTNIISRAMEYFYFFFKGEVNNSEKIQMSDCIDPRLEIIFQCKLLKLLFQD